MKVWTSLASLYLLTSAATVFAQGAQTYICPWSEIEIEALTLEAKNQDPIDYLLLDALEACHSNLNETDASLVEDALIVLELTQDNLFDLVDAIYVANEVERRESIKRTAAEERDQRKKDEAIKAAEKERNAQREALEASRLERERELETSRAIASAKARENKEFLVVAKNIKASALEMENRTANSAPQQSVLKAEVTNELLLILIEQNDEIIKLLQDN